MKKPLLLLHGALGSGVVFDPLLEDCFSSFDAHILTFSGHGNVPVSPEGFSIDQFAQELIEYIRINNLQKPNVFGYSMGGFVALKMESLFPGTLGSLFTLGTKFNWTPATAREETARIQPDILLTQVPAFAEQLQKLHGATNWQAVCKNTISLMLQLGEKPLTEKELSGIRLPVCIAVGDKDRMVSREESEWAATNLPNAKLRILDSTPHPLDRVNRVVLKAALEAFFG